MSITKGTGALVGNAINCLRENLKLVPPVLYPDLFLYHSVYTLKYCVQIF